MRTEITNQTETAAVESVCKRIASMSARLREMMRTAAGGTYSTVEHADLDWLLAVSDGFIDLARHSGVVPDRVVAALPE